MRRIELVLAILFLISGSTAWAQEVPTRAASLQDAANAMREAERAAVQAQMQAQRAELDKLEFEKQARLQQVQSAAPRPTVQGNQGVVSTGGGVIRTANSPFVGQMSTSLVNRSDNPIASLQVGSGTWWNNPDKVSLLGLTKDQQKRMDDIFQQHRIKLIDLNAALAKEETILEPLIAAEKLDESKIIVQIDRIAQARAELEKANSRLLLGLRQSLTMEQWAKVQSPEGSRLLLRR